MENLFQSSSPFDVVGGIGQADMQAFDPAQPMAAAPGGQPPFPPQAPTVVVNGEFATPTLQNASLEDKGRQLEKLLSDEEREARRIQGRDTKWVATLLKREPDRDEQGNIIDDSKTLKTAQGFKLLIPGENEPRIMTKSMVLSYMFNNTEDKLGNVDDPKDHVLRLQKKQTKAKGAKFPYNLTLVTDDKSYKLTQWNTPFDCVEFIEELDLDENNQIQWVSRSKDYTIDLSDPETLKKNAYIKYKVKAEFEPVFGKKGRKNKGKGNKSENSFAALLALGDATNGEF